MVHKDATIAKIKTFCETNSVWENPVFPGHLPIISIMHGWFQKALIARETAIVFLKESEQIDIESVF